jgi:hypothetical protein
MKATLILALSLLSATAWARGFEFGSFTCGSDVTNLATWKISNSNIPGLPLVEYTALIDGKTDISVLGLATVEEVSGGTAVGIRGLRGSDVKYILFFGLDGSMRAGNIACTKTK